MRVNRFVPGAPAALLMRKVNGWLALLVFGLALAMPSLLGEHAGLESKLWLCSAGASLILGRLLTVQDRALSADAEALRRWRLNHDPAETQLGPPRSERVLFALLMAWLLAAGIRVGLNFTG